MRKYTMILFGELTPEQNEKTVAKIIDFNDNHRNDNGCYDQYISFSQSVMLLNSIDSAIYTLTGTYLTDGEFVIPNDDFFEIKESLWKEFVEKTNPIRCRNDNNKFLTAIHITYNL